MAKIKSLFVVVSLYMLSGIAIANAEMHQATESGSTNPKHVYQYLLAEIAGQRGDLALASQLFLDLAKTTQDARIAERATRSAAYARQRQLTLESANLWAQLAPESVEALQASSEMLVVTGNVKSALPHMKKLLIKEETRARHFTFISGILDKQQDAKASYETIKELSAPYPNSADAQFTLARAAWLAEDESTAKAALEKTHALRPGWEPSAQMHGQILAQDNPEEAASYYKDFLSEHPNADKVRMSYAKLLVNLKRNREAKSEFIKLTNNAKGNPDTYAIVGLLSFEAKEFDMAKQYLQQALDYGFHGREQLYIYLGRAEDKKRNTKKALAWFDKVQPNSKHYLDAKLSTADVIVRTQNLDAAISMLDSLEDLSNEQRLIIVQTQASMLAQAERHQDAYNLIKKTVNSIPNTPQLLYDYAMAAERIGKLDEMERELRKVIKLQPDYAAAYNALGYSFADRNINLSEAKTLIETAIKLSPGDHYIIDSLGWVEYRLGNYATAIEHLTKAHNIQADPEISAHLGEVLWKQGRQEEARKIWDTALKNFPKNNILVGTSKKFDQ